MSVTLVLYTVLSIMDYYGENSVFIQLQAFNKYFGKEDTEVKKLTAFLLVLVMILGSVSFAFAVEADPNVTIVNPAQDTPVTSTNLLISVKLTKAETIRVNVIKETTTMQAITMPDGTTAQEQVNVYNSIFVSENFTPSSDLSFFTQKLENVATGNYIVRVDTLGDDGSVIYETSRKVTVKEKEVTEDVFTKEIPGTVNNFLQSLLKSIFGN